MNENNLNPNFTTWLEDAGGETPRHDLLQALDDLFSAGPGEKATSLAQTRLRRTLRASSAAIYYASFTHPLVGNVCVAVNENGMVALNFGLAEPDFAARLQKRYQRKVVRSTEQVAPVIHQVLEYLNGDRRRFDLPVDLSSLSDFQRRVLQVAIEVPVGKTVTYAEIARKIGKPKAARAVGQALGHNPIPIVIPCHRVIATDGSLGGYAGGLETKARLLALEGAALD